MKVDVSHIAKLANLPLKKDDEKKYEEQLSSILSYVEKLKEVNTNDIPETSQTTRLENITSSDDTKPSLTQDEATSGSKNTHNGSFKVKAILEQ